jgi:pre-mRNA-splicing factor ISY1
VFFIHRPRFRRRRCPALPAHHATTTTTTSTMARNVEKASNVLNRLLNAKQADARGPRARRPYLASECDDLVEADKWRAQVLREIGRKVLEIQNAGLGEARLRDLNDEINKLIREKGHWEARIVQLGGPDYAKTGPPIGGAAAGGSGGGGAGTATGKGAGYRYFGAAKDLPGVKELFDRPPPKPTRVTRAQLLARVNADYYGFRDEEDGVLVAAEEAAAPGVQAAAEAEWEARRAAAGGAATAPDGGAGADAGGGPGFTAYVPLPDDKEIAAAVLVKKKAALLAKYGSAAAERG